MHSAFVTYRLLHLVAVVVFAAGLAGCGSSVRAVRVDVVEQSDGPIADVTVSVISGSVRRDPLPVVFITDADGSVIVDSLARKPVQLSVVASDPRFAARDVMVPPQHDAGKKPFRVELELLAVPRPDSTAREEQPDTRTYRGR